MGLLGRLTRSLILARSASCETSSYLTLPTGVPDTDEAVGQTYQTTKFSCPRLGRKTAKETPWKTSLSASTMMTGRRSILT